MANKQAEVPGIGTVHLYKRRGARHIRLSVTSTGQIRVSLPSWVPYAAGVQFAIQKRDWLLKQERPAIVLKMGALIGKRHVLTFIATSGQLRTRLTADQAVVYIPAGLSEAHEEVQTAARKVCVRALRQEAEAELPRRLRDLAVKYDFSFSSVEVKKLKGRWGSCSHKKEIVLNCFLMQLPWSLIDYVLLHELTHTRIMAHGPKFWAEMHKYVPELAVIRKEMRLHQPNVIAANDSI